MRAKAWLHRHGLTDDWVAWAVGAVLVVGLSCPYLTTTSAGAQSPTGRASTPAAVPSPPAAAGVRGALTALDKLHRMGYTVNTQARAERAIRHWQKVNGLVVDGIVGPQTLASLGVTTSAVADAPAKRAPTPVGGPPADAPSDACAEMSAYRQAAGLPDQFDRIGYRESRCQNSAGNSCCVGWWANYLASHLASQSAYRDRIINECGVTAKSDIQGESDAQKRAQACVTFVVWDVTRNLPGHTGMEPWAL